MLRQLLFFLYQEVLRIVNGEMSRAGCNQLVDLPPPFALSFLKQSLVDAVLPTVHSCPSLACLRPSSIKVRTTRNSHFSTMLRMVRIGNALWGNMPWGVHDRSDSERQFPQKPPGSPFNYPPSFVDVLVFIDRAFQ